MLGGEAFDNQESLQGAGHAANAILEKRSSKAGWIVQAVGDADITEDQRLRPFDENPRPFLNAQAWFGHGLLALYRATGDRQWLEQAIKIGKASLIALEDKESGGFYASSMDETAAIIAPRKPLEANGTVTNFYYDLWV